MNELPEATVRPASRLHRVIRRSEPVCLVLPLVSMALLAVLGVPQFVLVSSIICVACMLPFFFDFEKSRLRARDLMPIVVMSALGVAGRLIFAPLPAIKPITAIVIVTALSFGRQTGYITGALTMLVSNIFFGQGPWTPWQMYTYGMVGYLSAVIGEKGLFQRKWVIFVFGFAASYFYGAIMDTWNFIGFVQPWTVATAIVNYTGGAIYNLGHAIGTVLFLIPIAVPWSRKFERVKLKYGIGLSATQQ